MKWTAKHDAFCLEEGLPPAAKLLWQWLLHHHDQDEEIEPDLKDFNNWVKKHRGKPYCRQTLKDALAKLVDCRIIQVVKKFTWSIARIVTRPLDWLKPKKNLHKRNQNCAQQPSNDVSTKDEDYSSSNNLLSEEMIIEGEQILTECENVGIVFDPIQSPEILNYHLEDVKLAIAHFQKRGGHEKVKNPQGWLLKCLREYWYDQPDSWSFSDLLIALGNLKNGFS
jgi:hypothetical protein